MAEADLYIYSISGQFLRMIPRGTEVNLRDELVPGYYIINTKKVFIK